MKADEYRKLISRMVRNQLRKDFPGLREHNLLLSSTAIARAIHARMYGANVDGVESPLWRDISKEGMPTETAKQILERNENEKFI